MADDKKPWVRIKFVDEYIDNLETNIDGNRFFFNRIFFMIMKLVVDFSSFTFDKKDQEKENL